MRELAKDHPEVKRRILVSLAPNPRTTDDGIEIIGVAEFTRALWAGELF